MTIDHRMRDRCKQESEKEKRMKQEAGLKLCKVCGNGDIHPADDGEGGIGEWCPHCNEIRWTQTSLEEIIELLAEKNPSFQITEGGCYPVCSRCGYQRQPKDEGFVLGSECPKCGVLYAKFLDPIGQKPNKLLQTNDLKLRWQLEKQCRPTSEHIAARHSRLSLVIMAICYIVISGCIIFSGVATHNLKQNVADGIAANEKKDLKAGENDFATAGITGNIPSDSYQKARELYTAGQYNGTLAFAKAEAGFGKRDPKVADTIGDSTCKYETQGDTHKAERPNNLADSRWGGKAHWATSLRNIVHQNHNIDISRLNDGKESLEGPRFRGLWAR